MPITDDRSSHASLRSTVKQRILAFKDAWVGLRKANGHFDGTVGALAILSWYAFVSAPAGPTADQPVPARATITILVIVAAIVARYLWVVFFDATTRLRKVFWTIVLFALVLGGFSFFYYQAGRTVPAHYLRSHTKPPASAFAAFGEPISKVDAFYFAVGTMTTAGAGSLTARSQEVRLAASIQMLCDLALLGLGLTVALRDTSKPATETSA